MELWKQGWALIRGFTAWRKRKTLFLSTAPPPLLHLLTHFYTLFLIPWGEGWMHSTCFLQNSCMHTSCSHSSLSTSFSQSTCCGCLVGFSTPEAFQATHTHTNTHPNHLPFFLCLQTTNFNLPCMLQGFKNRVSVLDLAGLVTRWSWFSEWRHLNIPCIIVDCSAVQWEVAVGISQPLGEPTAALWSDEGKELHKTQGESSKGMEMCCIQTTQWHTSQRPMFQLW